MPVSFLHASNWQEGQDSLTQDWWKDRMAMLSQFFTERAARVSAAAALFVAIEALAPVLAADLPAKVPPLAVAVAYNWSGCYVGGNAGWIGSNDAVRQYPTGTSINTGFQIDRDVRTATVNFNDSGFTGGVQAGCNWQPHRNWVYGIEADINGSTLSGTRGVNFAQIPLPSNNNATLLGFSTVMTEKLSWFGTARGRIGYAADRVLVYATGGLAYGEVQSSFVGTITTGNAIGLQYSGSSSATRVGWTAGGGIEMALTDNWSVKGEYLYVDLGKFSYVAQTNTNPSFPWGVDVTAREHIARIGLNYRFGSDRIVGR